MKAVILGTTGYTGMILLRLLSNHPQINTVIPVSSSKCGEEIHSADPGIGNSVLLKTIAVNNKFVDIKTAEKMKPDVVFAALPHLTSAKVCTPFLKKTVVIDLSADFRIPDPVLFKKSYGQNPPREDLLKEAVYGLCEFYREQIKHADIIANPGCYPTAVLIPLIPIIRNFQISDKIIVNALSGVSGAGRKTKEEYLFCENSENCHAYAPGKSHRHTSEIQKEINLLNPSIELFFTPHLVPLKRGMAVTAFLQPAKKLSNARIAECYKQAFSDSSFVFIKEKRIPETKDVWGSNRCDISWHLEGDNLILFSVIDNLIKGASGQAVQNMNIRFGFEETAGLKSYGEI